MDNVVPLVSVLLLLECVVANTVPERVRRLEDRHSFLHIRKGKRAWRLLLGKMLVNHELEVKVLEIGLDVDALPSLKLVAVHEHKIRVNLVAAILSKHD